MKMVLRNCLFILLMALSINICVADRIAIGVGTSYGNNVEWVPGHWYHGYWIRGQYVEYGGEMPGPDFVWMEGGFNGHHHWHNGHWRHR